MLLSVIIVNYKTPQLLLNCLASIYLFNTSGVQIIVVDNNSGDDTELLLKNNYPAVQFYQMGYNAGFARANNAGIKMALGENILLLNSDTIIQEDAINKCTEMLAASAFVAAGVQLLNEDGSPQISGNYVMKGGLNYLLPLPYTGKILKYIAGLFNVRKPSIEETKTTVEVDWINGAFLMVKKNILDKSGLLDEDFFLYAEESEWCSRIKKCGSLCVYGSLHVLHLQGESANDAFGSAGKGYFNLFDKKGYQIMLSNFVRIRKQFGAAWFFVDLFFYVITIPLFFITAIFSSLFFKKKALYSFADAVNFAKNVFGLLGFVPKIISGKPYFYKIL